MKGWTPPPLGGYQPDAPLLEWWGYRHINGSLHLKRFFDGGDLEEAFASPFVHSVYGPWKVPSREHALELLKKEIADHEPKS